MLKSAARFELESAYRDLVEVQDIDIDIDDRRLGAAMRVIAAWEAVSDEVKTLCETAVQEKALTGAQ